MSKNNPTMSEILKAPIISEVNKLANRMKELYELGYMRGHDDALLGIDPRPTMSFYRLERQLQEAKKEKEATNATDD